MIRCQCSVCMCMNLCICSSICIFVHASVSVSLQALVGETHPCLAPVFPPIWAIVSLQSQMQVYRLLTRHQTTHLTVDDTGKDIDLGTGMGRGGGGEGGGRTIRHDEVGAMTGSTCDLGDCNECCGPVPGPETDPHMSPSSMPLLHVISSHTCLQER